MVNNKLILIIILALFPALMPLQGSSITIPDTIAQRGEVTLIPVYADFSGLSFNSLSLEIEYNARMINIISVDGGGGFIIDDQKADIKNDFSNLAKARLTINSENLNNLDNGIICMLEIEGLVYEDSVSLITPLTLTVDHSQNIDFTSTPGEITVPGIPVFDGTDEGVGLNYPNPFTGYTIFPIRIEKETKIEFHIYNSAGFLVYSNENFTDEFVLIYNGEDGEAQVDDINSSLAPGTYKLIFSPKGWLLSNGSYYMVTEFNNKVYNNHFIYLK